MQAIRGTVYEWDLQTQVMYRSRGLFELLGIRAEDASPTNEWWTERIHPDDLERTQSEFLAAPAGSDSHSVRVRKASRREASACAERLLQGKRSATANGLKANIAFVMRLGTGSTCRI